ncbi:hypothetical protein KIN20_029973 [Parelaphostrongylus tenuis]|uniref:Uncharacterized protein n=1 Tax=Parelaphostrongylus tenuis TaxID=148309 RepID=A0AAD5R344_PARTN|nr:hypothetical protein KIN20_029973 [Parelaphostrongylus tenuis]
MDILCMLRDSAFGLVELTAHAVLETARQRSDIQCRHLRGITSEACLSSAREAFEGLGVAIIRNIVIDLALQSGLALVWKKLG